jgi:NADH-quinone oxidoreductase subunit C
LTTLLPDARAGHLVRLLRSRLGAVALLRTELRLEEDVLEVKREHLLEVLRFLRDDKDANLNLFLDVTCVDWLPPETTAPAKADPRPRFEVLYRLRSPRLGYRARVVVRVAETDAVVPSVVGLFPAADWYERELWDLFGVYPDGHPHLRRLLLYEGFTGHPMQRDYRVDKAQPLVPLSAGVPALKQAADEEGPAS